MVAANISRNEIQSRHVESIVARRRSLLTSEDRVAADELKTQKSQQKQRGFLDALLKALSAVSV